jgi:hypothetical protein
MAAALMTDNRDNKDDLLPRRPCLFPDRGRNFPKLWLSAWRGGTQLRTQPSNVLARAVDLVGGPDRGYGFGARK